MIKFIIGGIGLLLVLSPATAATNAVAPKTVPVAVTGTNGPAAAELEQLMEDDDAALAEVDQWIRDNDAFTAKGAGESKDDLNKRIRAKLDTIRKRYQDFLTRYPNNASGHLAYGAFLNDAGDEDLAVAEFEASRKLDPTNPAAWNNLANYYGEHGSPTNAFADYDQAIKLDPSEAVYYQNLATAVYLFRKDAREFYGTDETGVFNKSLDLYRKAMRLDPTNFALATDYAESYYGIRPLRTNDALVAWTNALHTANNDVEREGVLIHLARIKIAAGRFAEARAHLDTVTNSFYDKLKNRLETNLIERSRAATNTTATDSTAATKK